MKSLLVGLLFITSSIAFATPKNDHPACISRENFSINGPLLEIHLFGDFCLLSIPIIQAIEFVKNSEKVARKETSPFSEKITNKEENETTEYTANYSADTIDLEFFRGFAAVTICTADLSSVVGYF